MNILDALEAEIKRVDGLTKSIKKVLKNDGGYITMRKKEVEKAKKALETGDTMEIVKSYDKLKAL